MSAEGWQSKPCDDDVPINLSTRPSKTGSVAKDSRGLTLQQRRAQFRKSDSAVAFSNLDHDVTIDKTSYILQRSQSVKTNLSTSVASSKQNDVMREDVSTSSSGGGVGERVYYHVTAMLTSDNAVVPHDVHCIRVMQGTYLLVVAEVCLVFLFLLYIIRDYLYW